MLARYLIPLAMVACGLFAFIFQRDQTHYTAKTVARVFAKDCQENGRSRGGVMQYVFILNQKAYEGQAYGEFCRHYAIGGHISVQYVPDAPERNIAAAAAAGQTSIGGAIIWALLIYAGIIAAGWMIAPPPGKPWRKPIKSRRTRKP